MTCVRTIRRNLQRAFTLVELLVTITIVSLLAGLLLPAVNAARESARKTACANNLRQLGIGLQGYADTFKFFCSGGFNWRKDGCVTEVGWVANMVARSVVPGDLLCPSNPARLSEVYNDLISMEETDATAYCTKPKGSAGGTAPDGTPLPTPCRTLLTEAVGSGSRIAKVKELVYDKGYNTNFTASWFLVRSRANIDASGNLKSKTGCTSGITTLNSTLGGLAAARVESEGAPASRVPLLADGGSVDLDNALSHDMGSIPTGDPLAASMTAGPVNKLSLAVPTFASGTTRNGATGWWKGWYRDTLQDYRNFGVVHGGRTAACNILFADGGVRNFIDTNGDGVLNNGFDPAAYTGTGDAIFSEASVEIAPNVVYSYWTLKPPKDYY